jgi:hypothetical protein
MIDMNMCLPWFEGSDHWHWCASCASVASCFTVLLRERRIVQETFDFKVEGFVEDVGSHLCDLVYEWDSGLRKLCFVNAGE